MPFFFIFILFILTSADFRSIIYINKHVKSRSYKRSLNEAFGEGADSSKYKIKII